MSTPEQPGTEGTFADHSRSGADVTEGIAAAERGSAVQEIHDDPESKSGTAPVEQVAGDPEMTEGQVVLGNEPAGAPTGKDPREAGSGGAQSQPGARMSDRASAGQELPDGPPFTR